MPDLDDHTSLEELARQLSEDPAGRVSGGAVAEALGYQTAEAEPVVQRLKARGLINWSPGPTRPGLGWVSRGLALTALGYERVGL